MKKKKQNENRDKEKQKTEEELKKEMEELLQKAEEELGVDSSKVKVVRLNFGKRTVKSILFDILLAFILNLLLVLSISGYIQWAVYQKVMDLIWFVVVFTAIELILKNAIYIFFANWIIKTYGMILLFPTLFAIPIVIGLTDFVTIISVTRLLIMFSLLIFIRSLIKFLTINPKGVKI